MSADDYQRCLDGVNLSNLHSRRAATCLSSFIKMQLGVMHIQPGYICYRDELDVRSSNRIDSSNNLVVLRNYPGDSSLHQIMTFSPSFKSNFFYRTVTNYNRLRRDFDLCSFTFKNLKKLLQLFSYDREGLVLFN